MFKRIPRALGAAIAFPPQIIDCEICGGMRVQVRTDPSPRIGSRCLSCLGTAHHRGTFKLIREIFGAQLEGLRGASVYEISAHGALYKSLKRYAPKIGFSFTCSEFCGRPGIRAENIEALSFGDDSFDLITSTGLMEHVENDIAGYAEIRRVLKPGGYYLFTVPYHENCGTIIRAKRRPDGSIEHFKKPEYHSDPWHKDGVFTWRNYGPDILDTITKAGLYGKVRWVTVSGLGSPMPVISAFKATFTDAFG